MKNHELMGYCPDTRNKIATRIGGHIGALLAIYGNEMFNAGYTKLSAEEDPLSWTREGHIGECEETVEKLNNLVTELQDTIAFVKQSIKKVKAVKCDGL